MSTEKTDDTPGRYSTICGATNRNGEPCQLPAGWGTPGSGGTRCKFHGGASTGPSTTEHLEGNTYAEDNPGGGAPVGNGNSVRHGGWSDPDKFYERLEGEQKEYVDKITEEYVDRSKADLPKGEIRKKARRLATYHPQWIGTVNDTFDRGWVVDSEKEIDGQKVVVQGLNPALEADTRISRKQRKLMRELRVYPTSDGLPYPESVDSS